MHSFRFAWRSCAAGLALLVPTQGEASRVELSTGFLGRVAQDGNMFDVLVGPRRLTVTGLGLHLEPTVTTVRLFVLEGSWLDAPNDADAWTVIDTVFGIASAGAGRETRVDVADFDLEAGRRYGFYITTPGGDADLIYSVGTQVGAVAAQNDELTLFEGAARTYPFFLSLAPRVWNGSILYENYVPLPAAAASMLLGLGGLAALRLKRGAC